MAEPRLLVLASELPTSPIGIECSLNGLLGSRLSGVEVAGSIAYSCSADSLLERTVLGQSTKDDKFMKSLQKGCELYVGIKTPEENYAHQKADDGFDIYQFGERGFKMAQDKGVPAILLNNYDETAIFGFVLEQTDKNSKKINSL